MERDTTTWGASITKSVFATYVMQLAERHEFDLDKPVAQQLPLPLENYEAYREKASELVKDPMWLTVTPRMLLSHTSGLGLAAIEPDKKMHLHFKPGTQFFLFRRRHQPGAVCCRRAKEKTVGGVDAGGNFRAAGDDADGGSSTGRNLKPMSRTATT